jgi:hypothetical protein
VLLDAQAATVLLALPACLQDERALRQLADAMQAELVAAAGSRPDTPTGGTAPGELPAA